MLKQPRVTLLHCVLQRPELSLIVPARHFLLHALQPPLEALQPLLHAPELLAAGAALQQFGLPLVGPLAQPREFRQDSVGGAVE